MLEELTTKGAIGLLAYLLIWVAMARALLLSLRRRTGHEQVFVAVVGATAAAYFVQNMFLFDTATTTMLFALLAAFLISEERRPGAGDSTDGSATGRVDVIPAGGTCGPARWSGLRLVARALRSPAGVAAVVVVVSVLAGALLTYTFRPFVAAASVIEGLEDQAPWSREAALRRAIREFPGLGNVPRIFLISRATHAVPDLPAKEYSVAVEAVGAEGAAGLQAEPESWRLRIWLAHFYQVASRRDTAYLSVAREHLDEASRLAPGTGYVVRLERIQKRLESSR